MSVIEVKEKSISSISCSRDDSDELRICETTYDEEDQLLEAQPVINSSSSSSIKKSVERKDDSIENIAGKDFKKYFEFVLCFAALQISYLTWGVMQELIMNSEYTPSALNPSGKFPSATFCVFSNRFLAIIVATIACLRYHGTVQSSAPLLYFTPCAISNTISSFAQYQALSFVSFNLQTLFKATKVIPVMLMGKILKGTKYEMIEYFEAIAITTGVGIYSISNTNDNKASSGVDTQSSQIIGFCLLSMYVLSDSFTSQWQSRLYRDYGKIDHFHMMFGVNISSIILTILALISSGEIPLVLDFFYHNPSSLTYNILTAITSTTGQITIFYTIKKFGPIIFTIIMTTRQIISMALSTIIFGHVLSIGNFVGTLFVFAATFHSIRRQVSEAK